MILMKLSIEGAPGNAFVVVEECLIAVDQIAYANDSLGAMLSEFRFPLRITLKDGTVFTFHQTTVQEFAELLRKVASVT